MPVGVETIKADNLVMQTSYNCVLSGIQETPVYAMVSDQVEKINVKIGSQVNKDDVLIEFPVSNPSASYRQAEAALELSEQTFQRMQNLFSTGGISKQDLDGAETQYKVSKANFEAVQQAVKVKAPISGLVTDINVKMAQKVNPGDLLFTVAQLSELKGRIWLTENEISYVKKGMPVTVEWHDQSYTGKISDIALSMNPNQRAYGVDIVVNNAKNHLKSGVTAKIFINLIDIPNTILVPRNIVQKDANSESYVYIVENDIAVKRIIKTGVQNNLDFEVKSGLNEGDILIVEGFNIVKDKQKVKVLN